jgi:two-component system, chemotaxis family, sensor histidine kinase and response regulator WspE
MSHYSTLDLFCQEAEVQVGILQQTLPTLLQQPTALPALEEASRAAHAIWGSARLVQLDEVASLAELLRECCLMAQNPSVRLQSDQIDDLCHTSELLLTVGQAVQVDREAGLKHHAWNLSTMKKALKAILTTSDRPSASTEPISTAISNTSAATPPVKDSATLTTPAAPPAPANTVTLPTPIATAVSPPVPIAAQPPSDFVGFDSSMMDLFRLEAEAQVVILNDGVLELEANPQSGQALEKLMRAAHSLKGSARIVSLNAIVSLAHVMEDCFVAAQNKVVTLTPDDVDIVLQAVDLIQGITQVDNNELSEWLGQHYQSFEATRSAVTAILDPTAPIAPPIKVIPVETTPVETTPIETTPAGTTPAGTALAECVKPVPAKTAPAETVPANAIAPTARVTAASAESPKTNDSASQDRVVRVSAENLNRIMGLAGESLIEANWLQPYADSMLALKQRLSELSRNLEEVQNTLDRTTNPQESKEKLQAAQQKEQECLSFLSDRVTELELYAQRTANLSDRLYREVISSNMRPFADGVQGFPRMIRDLARKLNKQVKLNVIGQSTPVDRDILKKLEAPLTHILRNAVDHGIEPPEERIATGKPAEGCIRLEALHRGGMLAISIIDDGKGINPDYLRQKVVNKNLASPEMAAQMSEQELMEFLFLPGFSTAQQVTEISGRGVGLDIAKSMAQEVGGTVRAIAKVGKGTSFHFQLPLTLSVVRTLLVEISGKPYALPLARIDHIVTVDRPQISDVENREYFTLNQQNVGLIFAHQVLELPEPAPHEQSLPVVVISDQSNPYGLVVDRFLGERDLVVRPLDPRLGKVPDISATSLLEDGTPVLIIDVADIVRSIDAMLNSGSLLNKAKIDQGESVNKKSKSKKVLVVDDSITVREMERRLLENRGYLVDVAVDGLDGWNAARLHSYDLVISDIDMPRMNGIELVKQIKNHHRLQSTPVIVVSYRDRIEDRIQGMDAGADYYLTKSSFHDDGLINAVEDLIGQ